MGKINDLAAAWLREIEGYELSRSEFVKEGDSWYLRLYVDKLESGEYTDMSTDDCEKVSRYISQKLDAEDPIKQNYYLEVSSPGLDRLLVSEKDFIRFAGQTVDVKLYKADNGVKELSAKLVEVKDGVLRLEAEGTELSFDMDNVAKINLAVIF